MSQQSVLTTFFSIATPEQIAQNDKQEWATLHNNEKTQQAFNKVYTAMCAEKSAERQCKNDAKWACEYWGQHRVAKRGSCEHVSRFCMLLQLLTTLHPDNTQAAHPSFHTSSLITQCPGYPTPEGHQEAACIWNSTDSCQSTCQVSVWPWPHQQKIIKLWELWRALEYSGALQSSQSLIIFCWCSGLTLPRLQSNYESEVVLIMALGSIDDYLVLWSLKMSFT